MKLDKKQNQFFMLDIHSLTMNWEILDFRTYIDAQIALHQRLLTELDVRYQEFSQSYTDSSEEQYDPFEEEGMRYKDAFPAIMRKSVFLSIYSFLETELKTFVRFLYENSDHPVPFKKHPPGVREYIDLLENIVGIDFSELNEDILKIHDYTRVRSNLIHHNGDFFHEERKEKNLTNKGKSIGKPFRETINDFPGLEIDQMYINFRIALDQFLIDFLNTVEKLLNGIISQGKALPQP